MKLRSIFLRVALLLMAAPTFAGTYQRAKDGKTLVWNNDPKPGEEAGWSGKRDKNGFATGSGTLTWYKAAPSFITGSNIPDARRHSVIVARYSGEMVQGKFVGSVAVVDATGKKSSATFVDGSTASGSAPTATPKLPRQTAASSPAPLAPPNVKITPTPSAAKIAATTPTETPVPEPIATPTPEEMSSPAPPAEGPTATPEQRASPAESPTIHTAEKNAAATSTPAEDSLGSLASPPSALPKESLVAALTQPTPRPNPPTPSLTPAISGSQEPDAVAALHNQYQEAVKNNDTATMDRILADDFVLVTGRGGTLSKSDLIKAAREKRTNYEHQEAEEGTQKVRIWGDTAVVTALLRIKGTRDEKPLDYKIWSSDTYVRTPGGWRYVFGQTSTPLTKTDAK